MTTPWKEQMATIPVPGEDLVLEAVWQGGHRRGAVVAPPHPVYGGSLDHPVCNELAYGLWRAGWSSLRFNWRGVGASQGQVSGEPGPAERDYRAAVEQISQASRWSRVESESDPRPASAKVWDSRSQVVRFMSAPPVRDLPRSSTGPVCVAPGTEAGECYRLSSPGSRRSRGG